MGGVEGVEGVWGVRLGGTTCANVLFLLQHPTREGAGTAELGHIAFQGLNFNCHGLTEMMCGERVEYAWLMQLQLHRITGALSTLQVWGRDTCLCH